jgi:hypothetical protein
MSKVVRVECWADNYFFGKLLQNKSLIRKENAKSRVLESVLLKSGDTFAIGIVDHDGDNVADIIAKQKGFRNIVVEQVIALHECCNLIKIAQKAHFILS